MGAEIYEVTPTAKLLAIRDASYSTAQFILAPTHHYKIVSVVRDTANSNPSGGSVDDRLVMGLIKVIPTDLMRSIHGDSATLRFRAIVRWDPFTEHYKFVTSDYGPADNDTWFSANVR